MVGDLVDDISVRVLGDVTAASDTNAEIRLRPGGSAGNVAAWLGHLGTEVVFCGRVGADGLDRHTRALAGCGVEPHLAGDPDRTTATIVLQLDREGERTMFVDRGANAGLIASDIPLDVWSGVTWLHLTGYSFFDADTRPVATGLLSEARRRGARVSIDPSSMAFLRAAGTQEFLAWVDGVDLIFPNLDEARALVGSTGPQIDLDALAVRFPHVVVTLGSMGAAYLAGAERIQVTAPRVEVVDTRVVVGDERDGGVAERELASEHGFRVPGHADDGPPLLGVPVRLGARGEPRALDDDHRAAVHRCVTVQPDHEMTTQTRAVRVGEGDVVGALVVERLDACGGAVDQLVRHDVGSWSVLGPQTADGARSEDLPDAEAAQRP